MVRHIADIKPVRVSHADPAIHPALPTLVIFIPSVRLSGDEGTNVICPIVLIEREDAAPAYVNLTGM